MRAWSFSASQTAFRIGTSTPASTKVGIGTSAPKKTLEIRGGGQYISTEGEGITLKSPDGATCRTVTIDNTGALTLLAVTCP